MATDQKRENRLAALYMTLAAEFLERESPRGGLLTVTGVTVSKNRKNVTLLFTVFPDNYQEHAVRFVKRIRSDFREYVKSKTKDLAVCPIFDFAIDLGEKNRQRIDSLISKSYNK